MLSFVRRRITFANVAMTLALVFAMTGGAFAAGKFLITSTKQISPKVLKSLHGKAGPAGAAGAQGTAGPAGAVGAQGPAGAPGAKGETGPEGKEGKEGKAGKDGKAGLTGSPWTAGGTLPPGSTETGGWYVPLHETGAAFTMEVASFPIPLEHAIAEGHAHFINANGKEELGPGVEVESAACKGSADKPTAPRGGLCVYSAHLTNLFSASSAIMDPLSLGEGSSTTGALMELAPIEVGTEEGVGTWAVTAE